MKGYRMVEITDGVIKSLFHATNGSRKFCFDRWIKADKKIVHDGSHGKEYVSGFHFLKDRAIAEKFFDRNFRVKKNRYIVPCRVRKNIRRKVTGTCWLADEIKFIEREIETALKR